MRQVDIVIVGGGLAGASAAVMLGRADHEVVLVDPHQVYRPDFRCEKLDPSQMQLLRRMGLAGLVLPFATCSRDLWVTRFGRLIDKLPVDQYGIAYQDLVNAVRAGIPGRVGRVWGTVAAIEPGEERQIVRLQGGEIIDTRLVIVANGLNWSLRRSLGITCEVLSPGHSITIGFDIAPKHGGGFAFESLTYHGEHPRDRTAYLTLFKLGRGMRANLMIYRSADDPWLQDFREAPKTTLLALMPGLATLLGEFDIEPPIRIRPADLYAAGNVVQPGIVLVGDAFATSCPAAGTGTNKVLRDVERLCAAHIPGWLATPGMGAEKIAAFYADPEKQAEDLRSRRAAYHLKSLTLETGPVWRVRRLAHFCGRFLKGVLRRASARIRALAWAERAVPSADAAGAPTARSPSSPSVLGIEKSAAP